jgi:hypothetical protein
MAAQNIGGINARFTTASCWRRAKRIAGAAENVGVRINVTR